MTVTTAKVGRPVRHGEWGLTVDNMASPAEYIAIRYRDSGRRHSELFDEVARIPYELTPERALVKMTGMSEVTASTLVRLLGLKLISPKAGMADLGYRPVR